MKTHEVRNVEVQQLTQCVCDRCGRDLMDDDEKHECLSISYVAGYGSVFGDGKTVEGDFCQHCVKDVLGQWLTIKSG